VSKLRLIKKGNLKIIKINKKGNKFNLLSTNQNFVLLCKIGSVSASQGGDDVLDPLFLFQRESRTGDDELFKRSSVLTEKYFHLEATKITKKNAHL
jgi:hypothetical protein